jgi:hypothetical protein
LWIGSASSIISVIMQLPFPVLLFVVVYLLTIPKYTGRRKYMFLVVVELLLEAMFSEAVTMIRICTTVLFVSLYVFNLLFQAPMPNSMQQTMLEWKMELEAQQRRDTIEREARWTELLERQTQLADEQREARLLRMLEHQPMFPLVPVTITQQKQQQQQPQHTLTPTLVTSVTPNKPELMQTHQTLQNAALVEQKTDKKRTFENVESNNRDDHPPKKRQACM